MALGAEDTPEPTNVSVSDLIDQAAGTSAAAATDTATTDQSSGDAIHAGQADTEVAPTPGWKDKVSELGFQDVADDAEAFERLAAAYTQRSEQERQYQAQLQQMQFQLQMLQHQQTQIKPPGPTEPQAPTGYWNPPKVNHDLVNAYVEGRNEDGSIKWKANTPPQVVSDYNNEQEYYIQHANRLMKDWGSIESQLEARVLEKAKQLAQQEIQQTLARQQAETFVQTQIRENEDVLYQKDPVTNSLRYGFDGMPLLSEQGVRFQAILDQLSAAGVNDETSRWNYAQQLYKAQYGDLRQKQEDKVQQTRLAHLNKVTQRANALAPRNGQDAIPNGRNQALTFGQQVFANHDFKF
jgi:hypothetical protein